MYQLELTSRQYTDSTVFHLSLWQKLPNGGKEHVLLLSSTVPGPTEGLFEETPREHVQVALAHFAGLCERIGQSTPSDENS